MTIKHIHYIIVDCRGWRQEGACLPALTEIIVVLMRITFQRVIQFDGVKNQYEVRMRLIDISADTPFEPAGIDDIHLPYAESQKGSHTVGKGVLNHENFNICHFRCKVLDTNQGAIGIVVSRIGIGTVKIFMLQFVHVVGDRKIPISINAQSGNFVMQAGGEKGIKKHKIVGLSQNGGHPLALAAQEVSRIMFLPIAGQRQPVFGERDITCSFQPLGDMRSGPEAGGGQPVMVCPEE